MYPGFTCYRQAALVKSIVDKNYDEHNAVAVVNSLADLLSTVKNVESKLVVFTVQDVLTKNERINNERKYLKNVYITCIFN